MYVGACWLPCEAAPASVVEYCKYLMPLLCHLREFISTMLYFMPENFCMNMIFLYGPLFHRGPLF